MDVLANYSIYFGVFIALLSAGATFFNKQRFIAQNALLQAGNDELRKQNKDLRDDQADLERQITTYKTQAEERDKVIAEYKRQPSFGQLTELISNNHTQVIKNLAEITKILAKEPGRGQRKPRI